MSILHLPFLQHTFSFVVFICTSGVGFCFVLFNKREKREREREIRKIKRAGLLLLLVRQPSLIEMLSTGLVPDG